MTRDEAESVARKQAAVTSILAPLGAALASSPTFAGMYFDFPAGVLDIRTTSDPAALDDVLAKYKDTGVTFRVRQVPYAQAELAKLQAEISENHDEWIKRGVEVLSNGINVKGNRLDVHVLAMPTTSGRQAIEQQYGDRINLIVDATRPTFATCNSRFDCAAPIKGCLGINDPWDTGCTSGFVFRDIPYAGAWYVSTAGHCINYNGLGVSWKHNGSTFGTSSSLFFHPGANVDVGYIVLPAVASPGNQIMAVGPIDIRSITTWKSNYQQTVGTLVCKAGAASGYSCTTIIGTEQDVSVAGILIHHLWEMNYEAAHGDNGAPVFDDDSGMGSLSAVNTGVTWYSTLEWIYDTTGKTICTSASC